MTEQGYGDMYFQRTLEDWAKFDINNRTKFDASISSGLALMACNKNLYKPIKDRHTATIEPRTQHSLSPYQALPGSEKRFL